MKLPTVYTQSPEVKQIITDNYYYFAIPNAINIIDLEDIIRNLYKNYVIALNRFYYGREMTFYLKTIIFSISKNGNTYGKNIATIKHGRLNIFS